MPRSYFKDAPLLKVLRRSRCSTPHSQSCFCLDAARFPGRGVPEPDACRRVFSGVSSSSPVPWVYVRPERRQACWQLCRWHSNTLIPEIKGKVRPERIVGIPEGAEAPGTSPCFQHQSEESPGCWHVSGPNTLKSSLQALRQRQQPQPEPVSDGSLWGDVIQSGLGAGPVLCLTRHPTLPAGCTRASPRRVLLCLQRADQTQVSVPGA